MFRIKHITLASNMISGEGIETLRDALCKNTTLLSLDVRTIPRKNSLELLKEVLEKTHLEFKEQ